MYIYDNTYTDATSGHWKLEQFEENAIANLAITDAKIANLSGNKIVASFKEFKHISILQFKYEFEVFSIGIHSA